MLSRLWESLLCNQRSHQAGRLCAHYSRTLEDIREAKAEGLNYHRLYTIEDV